MYIIGGAELKFVYMLVDLFFFFFLQGPRPPQGATWLRPCLAYSSLYASTRRLVCNQRQSS